VAQRATQARRPKRKGQIHPPPGPEKAFGQALREVRKEKKLSQERLALDAGFDRTYISLVERGVRSPTVRAVVKLAEFLGVKPSEIVRRMEARLAVRQKSAK
jgi:transcriptional regulator with XRE-family HTH domain